jgi:hypothetical protein
MSNLCYLTQTIEARREKSMIRSPLVIRPCVNFVLAAASLLWALAGSIVAADSSPPGPPIEPRFPVLTDDIYATTDHHFSDTLALPEYYQWKRDLSGRGIDFVLLNTPIVQWGSENGQSYVDNEMDLYLQWRAFDNDRTEGKVFFWGLWVYTATELPSGAFAGSQGTINLPNGGATDPGKSVTAPSALWWEQTFKRSGLNYRVGQLYAASLWGANSYLGDDRATFMNTALSTNTGVPWAGGNRGLGAMLTWTQPRFYGAIGFQDAKGDQGEIDFGSFSDGKYSYLAEVGYTPDFNGRKGAYKFVIGQVDDTSTSTATGVAHKKGRGIILSAEQDVSDTVAVFGIYRNSQDRVQSNFETTGGAGFVVKQPWGWDNDMMGFSAFYGRPHDSLGGTRQDEYGIEGFYNLQLTPRLSFTPDVQIFLQPGHTSQTNTPVVVGFRLQYVL